MAETVILAETQYDGFEYLDAYGAYHYGLNPAPFTLTVGETYIVEWDGISYTCVAQDASAMLADAIGLGNLAAFAPVFDGNNEPFVIVCDPWSASYIASDTNTSHTVAIYQATEEEIPEGIVLKDRDGNDVIYSDVVGVKMLKSNGELVEFMSKEEAEGGGSSDAPYITYTLDDTGAIVGAAMHGFTAVPASCFYNHTALTTVDFSDSPGITSIGDNAFDGCTKLTDFEIPATVTSIGNYAFRNCKSLTDISLPIGLTEMGAYCFSGCTKLTSIIIPDNITIIAIYCFNGCTGLTSVTLNEGLASISSNAFYGCTSLTEITIPDNVHTIFDYAFNNCSKLASVTFGGKLKSIYRYAFSSTALTYAKFVVTEGWWYASQSYASSGTTISASALANTSTAATYLKTTYNAYYWKRT